MPYSLFLRLRLLLYPTGALALAFLLFYGKPGRKLLAVAAELTASVLVEMLFSAATMRAADFQMDAHYSVWADPHAVLYGGVFLLFLALVLLVVSLPFLRAWNNLSGRQLLVFPPFRSRRSSAPPPFRRSSSIRRGMSTRRCYWS